MFKTNRSQSRRWKEYSHAKGRGARYRFLGRKIWWWIKQVKYFLQRSIIIKSVFRPVSIEFFFVFFFFFVSIFVIISSVFRQVSAEFVEACASYINSLEPSAHPPFLLYWPLSHRQRKEYFLHLPATHRGCALHHWHPCDIYPYCKVNLSR